MIDKKFMSNVWSAAPTPYTEDWKIDEESIQRLADHHYNMGVRGVFIGGTSGEGPWLTDDMRYRLAAATAKANAGRIATALQITDNSAERMIENLKKYTDSGIDMVVIAPPFFTLNLTQEYIYDMYAKVIDASRIPVGIYHRPGAQKVEAATVAKLAELQKVVTVKDSVCTAEDTECLLAARDALRSQKEFYAYYGNEFDCVTPALKKYDGMMVGGGCFNARMVKAVFETAQSGRIEEAKALQERLNNLMYDVFGGKDISCWLAGQKQILVELGIFRTNKCIINYHLTEECAANIKTAMAKEKEFLCD